MKRTVSIALAVLAVGLLVVGIGAATKRPAAEADQPAADPAKEQPKAAKPDDRPADREAIGKVGQAFMKALEQADAKAVAAFWTEEGEYVGGDETTLHGRDAIEKAYAKSLKKDVKIRAEFNTESVRFLGHDSAVLEGIAKVQAAKADQPTTSRVSALLVRENDRWLMAVLREWPDEGVTLHDLDWLIGTWTAKTADSEVRTTYEWVEGKQFIYVQIAIKETTYAVDATQTIGKDPRTGQLHSWTFEAGGGLGEATWSNEGKRWVLEATGVLPDGSELTATNIITPVDKDSFTWQSVARTADGTALPDVAPIRVTRVK